MKVTTRGLATAAVWTGTTSAIALTLHTAWNLRSLRTPDPEPAPVDEVVSILLPVRNEAHRVEATLRSLLAQIGVRNLEIVVLDDGSTDGTAEVVRSIAGDDPRVRMLTGAPRPDGWLGKPWACQQLADAANGSVLVFVDADVTLATHAIASTVGLLRWSDLDLVSPYPQQIAISASERLVQPLLQWSWLTTLPLAQAERSPRESLAAANGQLLAIDHAAYVRAQGHAAVRDCVLDDIELLRAVKRSGGSGTVVDGTDLASCRMYTSWDELRDGYTKSLWAAFGTPAGSAATSGFLLLTYVVPAAAMLRGSRVGAVGYAAGVAGRLMVAARTDARAWPDALAHPASISTLVYLTAQSWVRKRRGTLTWKGRPIN